MVKIKVRLALSLSLALPLARAWKNLVLLSVLKRYFFFWPLGALRWSSLVTWLALGSGSGSGSGFRVRV